MTSSLFDPDSTSKTLNLFLLWFNERSESENLGYGLNKFSKLSLQQFIAQISHLAWYFNHHQ